MNILCAGVRQAITAAGTGCQAAMDAEKWLESNQHRLLRGDTETKDSADEHCLPSASELASWKDDRSDVAKVEACGGESGMVEGGGADVAAGEVCTGTGVHEVGKEKDEKGDENGVGLFRPFTKWIIKRWKR